MKKEPKTLSPKETTRRDLPKILKAVHTKLYAESGIASIQAARLIVKLARLDSDDVPKGKKFNIHRESRKLIPDVIKRLDELMTTGESECAAVQAAELQLKIAQIDEIVEVIPPLVFGNALEKHEAELANGLKELDQSAK